MPNWTPAEELLEKKGDTRRLIAKDRSHCTTTRGQGKTIQNVLPLRAQSSSVSQILSTIGQWYSLRQFLPRPLDWLQRLC